MDKKDIIITTLCVIIILLFCVIFGVYLHLNEPVKDIVNIQTHLSHVGGTEYLKNSNHSVIWIDANKCIEIESYRPDKTIFTCFDKKEDYDFIDLKVNYVRAS